MIRTCIIALVLCFVCLTQQLVYAERKLDSAGRNNLSHSTIKAAMIYRLLAKIQWPANYDHQSYRIGFVSDESQVLSQLQKASNRLLVNNKKVIVTRITADQIKGSDYEVIYVAGQALEQISTIAAQLRRTNTLLLTDQSQNHHDIMINFTLDQEGRQIFEVNRSNIVFELLTIDRDVIMLGGTELDVAELFRESEMSLREIKSELRLKEKELRERERKFALINQQLELKQQQISNQQQQITQFIDELAVKEQQINQSDQQLNRLNNEVSQVAIHLEQQKQALIVQQQQNLAQRQDNQQQLQLITNQQQKVQQLNSAINEKQRFLAEQQQQMERQQSLLDAQSTTIEIQQRRIWLVMGFLFFFVSLLIYILKINKERKLAYVRVSSFQDKLSTLAEIGQSLASSLVLEEVLDKIYQNLNRVLDANVFLVGIVKPEENRIYVPLVVENQVKLQATEFSLDDDARPSVWCVKHKKELHINEQQDQIKYLGRNMRVNKGSLQMESIVYEPLIIEDTLVGCLSVQSPEKFAYSSDQLELIRILSNHIAVALSNALGFRELAHQKKQLEAKHQALIETQQQLVQSDKLASLGTLTAGVAHEINNPTNYVQVGAQNLQVDLANLERFILGLTDEATDDKILAAIKKRFSPLHIHIRTINDGTTRISSIVKELKAFTHHDRAEKMAVNLNDCLSSTINLVQPNYKEKLSIVTHFQQLPDLYCYPAKLNQVFMNMIVNAADAILDRQKLMIDGYEGLIEVSSAVVDNFIWISIADNGSGMDPSITSKIFEPFYTTKKVGKGTGLGLSISYGIVQDHDGSVSVESTLGEGSRFNIKLPIDIQSAY